jgi:type IV secretion system protein VirB10
MNERVSPDVDADRDDNTMSPLPGEAGIPNVAERPRASVSKKGLLAVALFIALLIGLSALAIQRFTFGGKQSDEAETKRVSDRPTAATAEPRRLELPAPPVAVTQASTPTPRIPALLPTATEAAEPIGVRRTGDGSTGMTGTTGSKPIPPTDAPVVLVSSRPGAAPTTGAPLRGVALGAAPAQPGQDAEPKDAISATSRNLQAYQQQLHGLLDTLTKAATQATGEQPGQSTGAPPNGVTPLGLPSMGVSSIGVPSIGLPTMGGTPTGGTPPPSGGLFGGQLQGSATPRIAATLLGNRSLTLPKGTAFTCALKTKVISATSGLVGCQVQRNVYSDDGRVLLIERGSHMDGEYRISSVRPGTVRIPVLWTRIRTPHGVTVDIESPGTGQLGESGIDGFVDNRWFERIGAAMLLSLIDDSVKLVIQEQANQGGSGQANTFVLPSTTANTSKLAEKVLDSTINIPPLIYQNQGGIVGIFVARDVDFSSVYELKPVQR